MQADEEFGWFSCKVWWGFFLYFPSYLIVFVVRGVQFLVLAISSYCFGAYLWSSVFVSKVSVSDWGKETKPVMGSQNSEFEKHMMSS